MAFETACRDELAAPKPGNVHHYADGHRMTADDFIRSAHAAAGPIAAAGVAVGARILGAVTATRAAIGHNTNLGIILLCAPIAAAAEAAEDGLRRAVARVLERLDRADATLAFEAIVAAAPAGLGRSDRHDVHAPADAPLRQAMAAAADRDLIARQYADGFDEVFGFGLPVLDCGLARWPDRRWATLAVYLAFLSAFPDSHVVRKHGPAVGDEVRRTAVALRGRLWSAAEPAALGDDILAWDAELKRRGVNPGTSADLTVATLFLRRLRDVLPDAANSG